MHFIILVFNYVLRKKVKVVSKVIVSLTIKMYKDFIGKIILYTYFTIKN